MTTYQMIARQTGTNVKVVRAAAKAVLGNRHTATTAEVNQIIDTVNKVKLLKEVNLFNGSTL